MNIAHYLFDHNKCKEQIIMLGGQWIWILQSKIIMNRLPKYFVENLQKKKKRIYLVERLDSLTSVIAVATQIKVAVET